VVQLFRLLERESALPQKSSAFSLDTLGLHVLATLCRLYAEQFPHDDDLTALPRPTQAFAGVFRLVAERYQQKLSLTELAEAAHMHPSHFCRLFHRVMGITPMGYVIHHRVQVGRLLLSQTSRSVTDISHATGFYDTSHFCRTFARVMGMSPSEYRQSQPVADALASVWDVAPLSDPAPEQD
jgi:AraC-like DNA-binding protein